jgi:hypothetical protein
MAGTFAIDTAMRGLLMPPAAIPLPCPARPCFPDSESKNFKSLHLISFRLARTRARASGGKAPAPGGKALAAGRLAFPKLAYVMAAS